MIDRFTEQSHIGIHKVIALRDTVLSNSIVEALFRVLKYDYLYRMALSNMADLKRAIRMMVEDYNEYRPHYALNGGTPNEAYLYDLPERQLFNVYLQASKQKRIAYNKAHECGNCLQLI